MDRLKENTHPNEDGFSPMEVEGTVYTDKKAAGSAILAACKACLLYTSDAADD